jgi:hypothetical protein
VLAEGNLGKKEPGYQEFSPLSETAGVINYDKRSALLPLPVTKFWVMDYLIL